MTTADSEPTVRVLHVDDDPDLAGLVATWLEREDEAISVTTETTPARALETLDDRPVDCVVSDYDMPGMDGLALLDAVRREHGDLPFILFTGKGSEEVAIEAISRDVTDYLQKEGGTDQYAVLANRIRNVVAGDRSRRALERADRRFEAVFNDPNILVGLLDTDGTVLDVNGTAMEYVDDDLDAVVGERFWETPWWTDDDEVRATVRSWVERAADGEYVEFETELASPDERRYAVKGVFRPVTNAAGEVVSIVVSDRDVTERVERERKLERLRDRTQTLAYTGSKREAARVAIDAADDTIDAPLSGVHLLNEDRDALEPVEVVDGVDEAFDSPPRYERGAAADSRAGLVWQAFESGDTLRIDDTEAYDGLSESTPTRSVLVHKLGDHGTFIVSSGEPRAFDETDEMLVEVLSTTLTVAMDRLDREDRLRERERRVERLHDATRDLMEARTRRDIADRAVAAAEEILGFSLVMVRFYDEDENGLVPVATSESVADVLGDRPVFTPEGGSRNWAAYDAGEPTVIDDVGASERTLDSGTDLGSLLILSLGEHGTLSAGDTETGAFDESDVYLARILATATESALDRAEREEALLGQRDELERRNERLDEFNSILSHDLRNPLNVATGRLELLSEECDSEHVPDIERAHERMRALIDDLLTLAREGDAGTDLEAVPLPGLVRDCWEAVRTERTELVVETDRSIRADRGRLRQLLENLLRNAVEHGGSDVTVTVGALEDGDGFYLEDDGPGIDPGQRDHVFESGYSTARDGTGYGLSIVSRTAEAHGWAVTVTEGTRGGARFEVRGVEFA
ncbi:hybrid sensor histidine kinase/response regulator [Halorarum halobium]|uniref:hybrid sensor histidine kinase/response regulator n=1 Tax=Halorarum halobium TaxID=3075121 RepID=UPI0028A5B5F1|nr:GAF domain-containing protein [Halobaculum sp. XH14]